MQFKDFFETQLSEEEANIKETLKRLPANHRNLIRGYQYDFETGNTLNNDNQHVGKLDTKKKIITIAAPWRHSREMAFLHEIAHLVFTNLLTNEQKEKWKDILKKHPCPDSEGSAEENFCMIYANFYTKNKFVKFDIPQLNSFIAKLT